VVSGGGVAVLSVVLEASWEKLALKIPGVSLAVKHGPLVIRP